MDAFLATERIERAIGPVTDAAAARIRADERKAASGCAAREGTLRE